MDESLPSGQLNTTAPEPKPDPTPTPTPAPKAPVGLILAAVLIVAILIAAIVLLMRADSETTARVRDVFIIIVALQSLVIGVALVILMVQLATLINLLNNEIRPILQSTNDTVNTIKGTMVFLSDNLSEPVIKLNEYLAGLQRFFDIIRPKKF